MSWINLGEVFSVVHRSHGEREAAQVAAVLTGDPELLVGDAPWDHEDLRLRRDR